VNSIASLLLIREPNGVAELASADATLAFPAGAQFRGAYHSYYMSDAKSLLKVEGLSS
jgi:hypothetical protein